MASIMGAARGTYTPDMVLLLNPIPDEELGNLDGKKGDEAIEEGKKIREREAAEGFARQRLSIVKGRDGVQRGRVDLRFHFRQSRFEEQGLDRHLFGKKDAGNMQLRRKVGSLSRSRSGISAATW